MSKLYTHSKSFAFILPLIPGSRYRQNLKMRRIFKLYLLLVCMVLVGNTFANGTFPEDPYLQLSEQITRDTFPFETRHGDFINDRTHNPFDITPSIIKQEVEYDPVTGNYIIFEKVGDEYYRAATYMTFREYMDYRAKQQKEDQFNQMAGINTGTGVRGEFLDPVERIDISNSIVDRLFGGTGVNIAPKGNIDLTFGYDYQRIQNPSIPPRLQTQGGIDFDMDINMNVEGNIGDKLNLDFNYDTQASFDFDNKIKIDYDSEQFSEDDIIKKIEAGDVSFALPTNLIQGPQSLFGLKTVTQFGRLTLTGVASQQRSEQKEIQIENGALIRDFEIRPDDYDENRHFFISHYFRDIYENALANMPQVRSLVQITNIEVWVTNDQNTNLQSSTTVAAIDALGEPDAADFANTNPSSTLIPDPTPAPDLLDIDGLRLPDNSVSALFNELVRDSLNIRSIVQVTEGLQRPPFSMTQVRDFEIQSMRRLNSSEFTFHPQLGFISLNTRLRPNQVLSVAYEYVYSLNGNRVYKVGEMTNETGTGGLRTNAQGIEEAAPENVIYTKMLKSSNQRVDIPSWDLMMKNVYSLGTNQLTQEDFKLDIFYEDNEDVNLKRFLPEDGFRELPLLNFFQLDRLNSFGDPQEDGEFDFVPGLTVNTRTGSVFFPVLEPFGNSLLELLGGDEVLFEEYGFPELYDNAVTFAREQLQRNRFVLLGQVKSTVSSEISLNSFNIPQGSVTVRAGSQVLVEGIDYDIDYGIGRVKIINDAYLQQGVPIRVSFEDQSLFSLQQKTMFGLRADFAATKNLNIGATYMRLFERPFTEKVNIGNDPINNRVFGLDLNYSAEAPLVTRIVDKIPFINTKEESQINFSAEFAALRPGHSKAINGINEDEGVVSIDDFEGASSSIPLGTRPNLWFLASTPSEFSESRLSNNLAYGYNRALLNWYRIDDRTIRSEDDDNDPYTRTVDQSELFNRDVPISQIPDLLTFDVAYYPQERGPYNFVPIDGFNETIIDVDSSLVNVDIAGLDFDPQTQRVQLEDPESRWGGIMRYLPNNDFQASNFEYIEFWMLNPFMETRDGDTHDFEEGELHFQLGSVSEDILKDNLQFYENSIATDDEVIPTEETTWGSVPISIPQVNAFDLEFREEQDLGLDGLTDEEETNLHADYINEIRDEFGGSPFLEADPSADNFLSFRDEILQGETDLRVRYQRNNHPQGNAPEQNSQIGTGNPIPDTEDLNDNRSLDQNEAYYDYRVDLREENGEIQTTNSDFITDVITPPGTNEKWYRFQIPIRNFTNNVNDIEGFRSIQFMRMYFTGFETPKIFRLAEFELVRNQWRVLQNDCQARITSNRPDPTAPIQGEGLEPAEFIIDEIGIEENGGKLPFNYVSPVGIQQERIFNTFANVSQDENALNLRACQLEQDCDAIVYRLTDLDLRYYKRLQMFSHAETRPGNLNDVGDEQLKAFIRIGKDFTENYYEYEIDMKYSDTSAVRTRDDEYSLEVWREENKFDINLELLTELKKLRNVDSEAVLSERFTMDVLPLAIALEDTSSVNGRITIIGNPSLGDVKGLAIGMRHDQTGSFCGEVWVNELRISGLEERGGLAAEARLDIQMADFGDFTASTSYQSIGWGALEDRVFDRSLESVVEYDVATNLELGKFLPDKWNVSIPFYAQYSKQRAQDEFDPYQLDLTVDELLEITDDPVEREDIIDRSARTTTIKTYNFTNVRKDRSSGSDKKPKPWDIENVTLNYGHTRTEYKDEFVRSEISDDYRGGLDYNYTRQSKPIQPFKKIKSDHLKILKEFNFNPFPNSFSFSTQLRRFKNVKDYRIPTDIDYVFNDQRFDWERRYSLKWDFTKALKFDFFATNFAVVDEIRPGGIRIDRDDRPFFDKFGREVDEVNGLSTIEEREQAARDTLSQNLRSLGRNKDYNHSLSLSWNLPIRYLPFLDWVNVKAQYDADYAWTTGSLSVNNNIALGSNINGVDGRALGNIISNNQSRSVNATLNFDKLFEKSKYIKNLDKQSGSSSSSRRSRGDTDETDATAEAGDKRSKKDKRDGPSFIEKLLVRPLFSLKNAKFTYRENLSTLVPGFLPTNQYLGLSSGFDAPGWGFVLGLQPELQSFLQNAGNNGWITPDRFQNQQVLQSTQQNYDLQLELEPWKDFEIEIEFTKSFSLDHSEFFINSNPDNTYTTPAIFQQSTMRDIGSFDVSYFALQTLFVNDVDALFQTFENNRTVISRQLARLDRNGEENPNLGELPLLAPEHPQDEGFEVGFGRQQNDVLIHSFLSAYTGTNFEDDPNKEVSLNITEDVSRRGYIPAPNWSLRWDGLSKIGAFQDIFSSFTLTHGYNSNLRVSRFETDLQFASSVEELGTNFGIPTDQEQQNYFALFEIPTVVISENFVPIIGLELKTHNDINIEFEFRKTRNLSLITGNISQLTEARNTEYTGGFGWTVKGFELFSGNRKKKRRGRSPDTGEILGDAPTNVAEEQQQEPRDLIVNFIFSFRDDITSIHEIDRGTTSDPTRGLRTLRINPSVEYDINSNLSLRAFVDYSSTRPYLSNTFPITSIQAGVTARFNLE